MTKRLSTLLCLTVAALFPACTAETPNDPGSAGGNSNPDDGGSGMANDHGDGHALGKLTVGAFEFEVTQYNDVAAGAELAFDLQFATEATLPDACRGWVGAEDGKGSRKGKLSRSGDSTLHGHAEVPDPLTDAAAFWVEIETEAGTVRGSLPLHR